MPVHEIVLPRTVSGSGRAAGAIEPNNFEHANARVRKPPLTSAPSLPLNHSINKNAFRRPTLGIIGGGQLAKMTAHAAAQLGCETVFIERQDDCPTRLVSSRGLIKDWSEVNSLLELSAEVDVVTLENEFVDAALLAQLEERGHRVLPSADTMRLIQDKFIQKQTLLRAGLATTHVVAVENLEHLKTIAREWGFPFLVKARHLSYDGKGNATISSDGEIEPSWQKLGGDAGRLIFAEQFCRFERELAVIVTRSVTGELVTYPVVQTVQRDHVCHHVVAPAEIPPEVILRAEELARAAVIAVNGVGSFGIEMFQMPDGEVLINELAPRVHNSGHYTIEGCDCSQFENHVRAVLGWPLGSTRLRAPSAMVNLLGHADAQGVARGLAEALKIPGAHVHIYGKSRAAKGRKMGHVTALGPNTAAALATAQKAADSIRFE